MVVLDVKELDRMIEVVGQNQEQEARIAKEKKEEQEQIIEDAINEEKTRMKLLKSFKERLGHEPKPEQLVGYTVAIKRGDFTRAEECLQNWIKEKT